MRYSHLCSCVLLLLTLGSAEAGTPLKEECLNWSVDALEFVCRTRYTHELKLKYRDSVKIGSWYTVWNGGNANRGRYLVWFEEASLSKCKILQVNATDSIFTCLGDNATDILMQHDINNFYMHCFYYNIYYVFELARICLTANKLNAPGMVPLRISMAGIYYSYTHGHNIIRKGRSKSEAVPIHRSEWQSLVLMLVSTLMLFGLAQMLND